jgi:type I restriction enzyme M protein
MIDEINWTSLGIDVQASVFEGLLERAAAEGKKGAGQYFTPRPLIDCIVACAKPDLTARPNFKIIDPACGTGGFLASAHDWFIAHAAPAVGELRARQLSDSAYFGVDLVARPRRLALMNMYLRGVNAHIIVGDSIYGHHDIGRFNLVLTNPPFGSHGVRGIPHRPGYPVKTSNKQINFIQHSVRILMDGGLAAIVAPDNVLFSAQGTQALRAISETSSIHTILRCPNGTFTPYTQGTKTNVIFISKGTPTKTTWIYDARTGVRTISRRNPLTPNHFVEFTKCYGKALNSIDERTEADSSENRWRCFSVDVLNSREFRIDSLRWLDDNSEEQGQTAEPIKLIADALAALSRAEKGLQALQSLMRENTHDDT